MALLKKAVLAIFSVVRRRKTAFFSSSLLPALDGAEQYGGGQAQTTIQAPDRAGGKIHVQFEDEGVEALLDRRGEPAVDVHVVFLR